MTDTNSLEVLIQALKRLPGVGVKSASRMAFHLLQHDRAGALALSFIGAPPACEAAWAPKAKAVRIRALKSLVML